MESTIKFRIWTSGGGMVHGNLRSANISIDFELLTPSTTSRYMVKMVKASFQHKEQPRLKRWNGLNLFGMQRGSLCQKKSVDPDV